MDRIQELVSEYAGDVIAFRRQIHRNPELTGEERETAELAASVLRMDGIELREGIGGYGVTGLIRGKGPGRCVALRADMDALSVREETGLDFASRKEGVMHACGHDCHTSMLLGAAKVLCRMRDSFCGSVKLIFQPAEEDSIRSGSRRMIRDGVLLDPEVSCVIGQHMDPRLPLGTVAAGVGPCTAASDRFFIRIHGKTAHGSEPDRGTDAVVIAAHVITALQSIVSRQVSPQHSSVLTIGKIHGGERYNVIPGTVEMEGTCRNADPETRNGMAGRMETVIHGITEGLGGSFSFEYVQGYSPTVNDPCLVEELFRTVREEVPGAKGIRLEKCRMVGEDFSYYSEQVPAVFYWLGCSEPGREETSAPLHSSRFSPDERSLALGTEIMVRTALNLLRK